jgi:hypothetical protein
MPASGGTARGRSGWGAVRRAFAGGLALAALATAGAGRAGAAEKLFQLEDPSGDDHGDGTLRYPLNYYGLAPGDLDLVSLSARKVGGGTEFQATFGAPIRSPAAQVVDLGGGQMKDLARFGFYGLNLDIYVDVDRVAGSGGVRTLPGRKSTVRPEFAWEKAIVLTPRPYEAKSELKRALLRELRSELAAKQGVSEQKADELRATLPEEMEQRVFFPSRIRVSGRKIAFWVPDEFLGGPAKAEWGYVVFTTGADVDQRFTLLGDLSFGGPDDGLFVLPAKPGGAADRFGGQRDDDLGLSPIVDLLVPRDTTQERVLADYARDGSRLVALPGVVPAAKAP